MKKTFVAEKKTPTIISSLMGNRFGDSEGKTSLLTEPGSGRGGYLP